MASAGTSFRQRFWILDFAKNLYLYFTLVVGDVLLCYEQGREELDVGKAGVVSSQRPEHHDVCDGGAGEDLLLGSAHRGPRRGRQRPEKYKLSDWSQERSFVLTSKTEMFDIILETKIAQSSCSPLRGRPAKRWCW